MAYFLAEKADSEYVGRMSGIDFARSDLSPDLLCELVLKDEFTFQIGTCSRNIPKNPRGALLYNRGYGCASGIFKPLPFADQNFGKILDPLQTNGGKVSKIYTLKCRKMNF